MELRWLVPTLGEGLVDRDDVDSALRAYAARHALGWTDHVVIDWDLACLMGAEPQTEMPWDQAIDRAWRACPSL